MDNSELLQHSKTWDRSGVLVAALCIAHCLAFPFIIAALPATRIFLDSLWLEALILFLGVVVGSISFVTSYKKHQKFGPMLIGFLGVLLLLLNLLLVDSLSSHGHGGHSSAILAFNPLMVFGGTLLIAGHLWNIRECHCFCDKSCTHHDHQAK